MLVMQYEWSSIDFVDVTYIMVNDRQSIGITVLQYCKSIAIGIAILCRKLYWHWKYFLQEILVLLLPILSCNNVNNPGDRWLTHLFVWLFACRLLVWCFPPIASFPTDDHSTKFVIFWGFLEVVYPTTHDIMSERRSLANKLTSEGTQSTYNGRLLSFLVWESRRDMKWL